MPQLAISTDMRLRPELPRRQTPRRKAEDRIAPPLIPKDEKAILTPEEEAIKIIFEVEILHDFAAGCGTCVAVFKRMLRRICKKLRWSLRMAHHAIVSIVEFYDMEEFWNAHPDAQDYGWDMQRMSGEAQAWLLQEDESIRRHYFGVVADIRLRQRWALTLKERANRAEKAAEMRALQEVQVRTPPKVGAGAQLLARRAIATTDAERRRAHRDFQQIRADSVIGPIEETPKRVNLKLIYNPKKVEPRRSPRH